MIAPIRSLIAPLAVSALSLASLISAKQLQSHHKSRPNVHFHVDDTPSLAARATANTTAVLDVFQVYDPVVLPASTSYGACADETILLMDHKFGYSYGEPYVGKSEMLCHLCAVALQRRGHLRWQ